MQPILPSGNRSASDVSRGHSLKTYGWVYLAV